MARILISNAMAVQGPKDVFSYGVKLAADLSREFGLFGIELTTRWGMRVEWLKKQISDTRVVGVHAPWTWQYWRQIRYNHQASFRENVVGFLAMAIQPPMKYQLAFQLAQEFNAYLCVHPDIFMGIENNYLALRPFVDYILVENNCEKGFDGVRVANSFAQDIQASGILLDTNHLGLVAEDSQNPEFAYGLIKGRIKAVHIADYSDAYGRAKLIPGTGDLEWLPKMLEWLREDGFEGPYVLEVRHPGISPKEAVERSLEYLAKNQIQPG
jgi:hypothetical protein